MAAGDLMLEPGCSIVCSPRAALDCIVDPLVDVIQDLSLAHDLPAIMEIVRRAARELTGADGASFILRDGDLCYYAEENAIGPLWKGRRFPMSACISGWVMLHREPTAIEDIYVDPRIPIDAYAPTFVRSLCMVPIRTKAPIGAIGNYWASQHRATPRELGVLHALADSTSVAMQNVEIHAELERRVQDRTLELERKRRELAAEHTALLELQRQKEALSALVVHDLRSPASAIMSAASARLLASDLQATDRRLWSVVSSSAEHIARTAANLLDIAVGQEGRLVVKSSEVELGSLFAEVRELLLPLAKWREQAIELSVADPCGPLFGDTELLRRVLQNLVDNALRHSPARSIVRLEARANVDGIRIAVCDAGPGIPAPMRERIFDRYVRIEDSKSSAAAGFGLGLTFCRMAVEAHGGTIWVEDNEPRGSRFCFRLPVAN